jgi:hypothetical protein
VRDNLVRGKPKGRYVKSYGDPVASLDTPVETVVTHAKVSVGDKALIVNLRYVLIPGESLPLN